MHIFTSDCLKYRAQEGADWIFKAQSFPKSLNHLSTDPLYTLSTLSVKSEGIEELVEDAMSTKITKRNATVKMQKRNGLVSESEGLEKR